jgi:hypothetical protein
MENDMKQYGAGLILWEKPAQNAGQNTAYMTWRLVCPHGIDLT